MQSKEFYEGFYVQDSGILFSQKGCLNREPRLINLKKVGEMT